MVTNNPKLDMESWQFILNALVDHALLLAEQGERQEFVDVYTETAVSLATELGVLPQFRDWAWSGLKKCALNEPHDAFVIPTHSCN